MQSTETMGISGSVGAPLNDTRRLLQERRRDLLREIQGRVRDVREGGVTHHHRSTDLREVFEAEPEDDLAFAVIQMKAEMLENVSRAVRQLDEGTYGVCVECEGYIAESRLRALPFAVRCLACEEARELMPPARNRVACTSATLGARY
jgi:DnaK suppressor protein